MEAVIKLGGSLAGDPKTLKSLCIKLSELAKTHKILVIPGGGEFADVIRKFDKEYHLSSSAAHKMAILAMDQYGLLLADITPNSRIVRMLDEAKELSKQGFIPIMLPSELIFHVDPLEHSWEVTSDSIAAYVASILPAKRLVLITDVDGIYTNDPKKSPTAKLIKEVSAKKLLTWKVKTCIDTFLPKILLEAKLDCYVVNGKYPKRIRMILEGENAICTKITV
jgi:aspartokinase-like uncharacterized kinase